MSRDHSISENETEARRTLMLFGLSTTVLCLWEKLTLSLASATAIFDANFVISSRHRSYVTVIIMGDV